MHAQVVQSLVIRMADLDRREDQQAVLEITDQYAQHAMGGSQPLRPDVRARLIEGLRSHPMTRIFLAWQGDTAVGIATCFVGFSSFAAKPLINIHDLAVVSDRQGQGIGRRLIESVVEYAQSLDCSSVTLEVRMDNSPARKLYDRMGFQQVGDVVTQEAMLFGKLKLSN